MSTIKKLTHLFVIVVVIIAALYSAHTYGLVKADMLGGIPSSVASWVSNQVDQLLGKKPNQSHDSQLTNWDAASQEDAFQAESSQTTGSVSQSTTLRTISPQDALSSLQAIDTNQVVSNISEQVQTTAQQLQKAGQDSGAVLGEFIQAAESDPDSTVHEKALEYSQYLYCQQVVKSWEDKNQ